jgi:cGMP-dependent protein kinase
VELLRALTEEQLNRVAEAVKVVTYKRGERIITKGELGSECYFVRGGRVRCFGATAAGKPLEDLIIPSGGHFGERALLLGAPRAANVEADDEEVTCYVLGRKEFSELLGPLKNLMEQGLITRVFFSIPALAALSATERDRVISRLQTVELADKQVLARPGQALNTFFLVKAGTLRVVRGGREETMGQGAYLGDRALFKEDVADAEFSAQGPVTVFALDRRDFEAVVGAAAKAGAGAAGAASAAPAAAGAGGAGATGLVTAKTRHVKKEELEVIRTLGAGTFGRVKLVRHKPTNKPFAMKVLQKAQVVAYGQQKNVMNERNVLMQVRLACRQAACRQRACSERRPSLSL